MGSEIELKIPLSKGEYDSLYKKFFTDSVLVSKKDEYFSRYKTREERKSNGEPEVIRIRTEKESETEEGRSYFTLKRKKLENGIEVNAEYETFVEKPEVILELFNEAGYFKWFEKDKSAYSYHAQMEQFPGLDFHMELVTVNGLTYAEIEVTDAPEYSNQEIKKALETFTKSLGLDVSKKDSRSWYKIISDLK